MCNMVRDEEIGGSCCQVACGLDGKDVCSGWNCFVDATKLRVWGMQVGSDNNFGMLSASFQRMLISVC